MPHALLPQLLRLQPQVVGLRALGFWALLVGLWPSSLGPSKSNAGPARWTPLKPAHSLPGGPGPLVENHCYSPCQGSMTHFGRGRGKRTIRFSVSKMAILSVLISKKYLGMLMGFVRFHVLIWILEHPHPCKVENQKNGVVDLQASLSLNLLFCAIICMF